ncbi:MAG: DUF2970 domain-containing protein [Pseudomonadota bacterium]
MNNDKISFFEIVRSVVASMIGIQSEKNRERDFKKGSASVYLAAGIIGTIIFVLILYAIVSAVLSR